MVVQYEPDRINPGKRDRLYWEVQPIKKVILMAMEAAGERRDESWPVWNARTIEFIGVARYLRLDIRWPAPQAGVDPTRLDEGAYVSREHIAKVAAWCRGRAGYDGQEWISGLWQMLDRAVETQPKPEPLRQAAEIEARVKGFIEHHVAAGAMKGRGWYVGELRLLPELEHIGRDVMRDYVDRYAEKYGAECFKGRGRDRADKSARN